MAKSKYLLTKMLPSASSGSEGVKSTSGSCRSPMLKIDTPGFASSDVDAVVTALRFPNRLEARRMNYFVSAK
jgi:hypothetical protein